MKVLFFFFAPSCGFRAKRESFTTCMASEKNAYFSRISQVLHFIFARELAPGLLFVHSRVLDLRTNRGCFAVWYSWQIQNVMKK